MTGLLKEAFEKASCLPKDIRDSPAKEIIEEIEGELRWDDSLSKSQSLLEKMANKAVWKSQNFQDMVIVKTFLYTGLRVSELIRIRLEDVDYERYQIRVNEGEGSKDRIVPFPRSFKEVLAMHADRIRRDNAEYLFESSWKRSYTERGIRKILAKYAKETGIRKYFSPQASAFSFDMAKETKA